MSRGRGEGMEGMDCEQDGKRDPEEPGEHVENQQRDVRCSPDEPSSK
eukprot:CAMPEP_0182803556 /NCGR_PEP_ID=MMETSP0006_2-20121128/4095_1 /TAXON_ID=97485 /ORGANISM="Prymnesium parvum, Strain Texoma1" /LENGTH=46 /DNA_ID= /DNA_START= /DNA_END= /DNA_ORIENTATION=